MHHTLTYAVQRRSPLLPAVQSLSRINTPSTFLPLSLLYLHFAHFDPRNFLLSPLMSIDETVKLNRAIMTLS